MTTTTPTTHQHPYPYPYQHHGTTTDQPLTEDRWCEACRARPATVVWAYPPAGAQFQLCPSCWRTPTHHLHEERTPPC